MKKTEPIEQMFQNILRLLKGWGLSKYSISNYYYNGICPIRVYYNDAEKILYDESFTKSIVMELEQKRADGIVSESLYKYVRKVSELLRNYNDTNFVWKRIASGSRIELKTKYYVELLNNYRSYECQRGLQKITTINTNSTLLRHFFRWMEHNSIGTLEQLTLKDVGDFLTFFGEKYPYYIASMLGALRNFDAFIKRRRIASCDFSSALTARPAKRSKLMPVFSHEDTSEILSAVNRSSPLGKRDYAILTIAKELGIRACDIINLKLSDIYWENNEIRFRQVKTGAELILPLEPVVGNAIAEYILEGRPKTDSPYIFIRSRAPFVKMTTATDIIRRYAPHSKYQKMSGFHSFRRGLASQMLNAGVAADTVKNILGHTKINSLKPYIRISDMQLKTCAMDLTGIETNREVLILQFS